MGILEAKAKEMLGSKFPRVVSRPDVAARQKEPGPAAPACVQPEDMNKTEALYVRRLDSRKLAGEILAWRFEALTFRLAYRCHYTPDFLVVTPTEIQIHEIKGGYVREDGLIKWKMAAEAHPEFRFFLCKYVQGHWRIQEYKRRQSCNSRPTSIK
jgi:hypothetical protein